MQAASQSSSTDGLDLSQSSLIQGSSGTGRPPSAVSFPYQAVPSDLKEHWRVLEEGKAIPFVKWDLKLVVAWMEAGLGELGQWIILIQELLVYACSNRFSSREIKFGVCIFPLFCGMSINSTCKACMCCRHAACNEQLQVLLHGGTDMLQPQRFLVEVTCLLHAWFDQPATPDQWTQEVYS